MSIASSYCLFYIYIPLFSISFSVVLYLSLSSLFITLSYFSLYLVKYWPILGQISLILLAAIFLFQCPGLFLWAFSLIVCPSSSLFLHIGYVESCYRFSALCLDWGKFWCVRMLDVTVTMAPLSTVSIFYEHDLNSFSDKSKTNHLIFHRLCFLNESSTVTVSEFKEQSYPQLQAYGLRPYSFKRHAYTFTFINDMFWLHMFNCFNNLGLFFKAMINGLLFQIFLYGCYRLCCAWNLTQFSFLIITYKV